MSDGDPEDWPVQPVELRQLERSLRCQICQDVYQGPVSLTCGHTFCSMCIRSTLSVFSKEGRQQACPTCREAADVTHLRPIQHLRDAAAAWKAVRQLLLLQHLQAVDQQQQQAVKPLVVQQQQRQAGQQQRKDPGNGKSLQQQQQTRRPSRTPPSGTVSRQISGSTRQASGSSRGHQKTPEPAITISSTGAGGSQGAAADELDASEDEVASVQQDSDPDWSAEDADHQQQQQRQGQTAAQPTNKRRLRNSSTSTGLDASPLAADADDADSDGLRSDDESDFEPAELPAPKRARAAVQQPGPGKENQGGPAAQQQPAQAGSSAPHQQQQPQQPGYVACPICSSSVKGTFINSHIDSCLARISSGQQQQQQRSAGRASTTAGKRPAAVAAVGTRTRVSIPHPVTADAVANGSDIPGGSGGTKLGSGRLTTAAGGVGVSSGGGGGGVRRARVKVLEPPPKLCFDLMKDKELKGKLTQLGLSSEGGKKVCAQRYTSFRNYVLSLQDSGANMTQKEAAAEFTRGERKHARAASRPLSVAALASAGGPATGAAAAGQRSGSRGPDDRSVGPDLGMVDNSYATLIHQTKELMAKRKQQAEQQEQQQVPEQPQQQELLKEDARETAAQTSLQQHDGEPSQLDRPECHEAYTADIDLLTEDLQQHDRGVAVVVTAAADTGALKQQQLAVVAAALDACTAVPCVAMEPDCYQGLVVPDSQE